MWPTNLIGFSLALFFTPSYASSAITLYRGAPFPTAPTQTPNFNVLSVSASVGGVGADGATTYLVAEEQAFYTATTSGAHAETATTLIGFSTQTLVEDAKGWHNGIQSCSLDDRGNAVCVDSGPTGTAAATTFTGAALPIATVNVGGASRVTGEPQVMVMLGTVVVGLMAGLKKLL